MKTNHMRLRAEFIMRVIRTIAAILTIIVNLLLLLKLDSFHP
jgi:hypothetical protein